MVKKIAIIGTGIAGLTLAHLLKERAEITLFEKARGVGGRVSTRRAEPYVFDHGAQYFTAKTPEFQEFIQPLIDKEVIQRWNPRYVKFDGKQIIEQQNWSEHPPRYVGVPTMNRMMKSLAEALNIKTHNRIISLQRSHKWLLVDDQNEHHDNFDWVVLTIPSNQATELLPLDFKYSNEIKNVKMDPCFSLMLGFKEKLNLEFEAAHVMHSDLSWIAVNSHKPHREENHYTLIVHSSQEYAAAHIHDDPEAVMEHLIHEASDITGRDLKQADYKSIHPWRYATHSNEKQHPIFLDPNLQLGVCGDWCNAGRVEGGFTSANNLAKEMLRNYL